MSLSSVPAPRTLILRRQNSTVLAFWALPLLVFKTIIIDIFFILYKAGFLSYRDQRM